MAVLNPLQTGLKRLATCTLVWILLVLGVMPGTANGAAMLLIDPGQATIPLGSQITLNFMVQNGVNVNAFDINVAYDQERLALAGWSYGDFLSNLFCLREINQPGRLELACTQLASPGVSGNGVLLKLNFSTKMTGSALVEVQQIILADPQGGRIEPDRVSSSVLIQDLQTAAPTQTRTPTQPLSPTATATPEVTPPPPEANTPTEPFLPTRTHTPASLPEMTPSSAAPVSATPTGAVPPGEDGILEPETQPTEAVADSILHQTQTPAGLGTGSVSDPHANAAIETILWVALGVSTAALLVMAVIVIIKKTKKEESYLL